MENFMTLPPLKNARVKPYKSEWIHKKQTHHSVVFGFIIIFSSPCFQGENRGEIA